MTTDYSTSKYQDELTERAYAVTLDGLMDAQVGDLSEGRDWCALVVVDGGHVIIREDAQGFVWCDYSETGLEHGSYESGRCAVRRAWEEYERDESDWYADGEA